ncbi:MAG TPA: fumarylacetoacetate hydrolase family protein [Candidatus Limnocylindria bacterium]|nr:fumarylacetoacetate hydrolase family protein [Candidatus Limnocylindria bacterium]
MKLVAYDRGDGIRHGYLADAGIVDLGPGDVMAVIRNGIETTDGPAVAMERVQLLAPIGAPGKIVCIGLNYHDHCREQHIDPPAYPRLFGKFANAVNRPGGTVRRPAMTEQLDQECELAVVIGQRASGIGPEEAMDHVFGYTILNDITMRELQREDRQWLRAKGSDGFAPMGPAVVTADEIRDPQTLRMRSFVNDEPWQDSSTAEMVFDVPTLIAFVSRTIALEPGDVLSTGTPAGVGHYQQPPRYLQDGDRLRCEIEGMGVLENIVADELPRADDHAAAAGMGAGVAQGSGA